jgi:hypothetical protein
LPRAFEKILNSRQIAQRAIWHFVLFVLALFSSAVPFLPVLFYPICVLAALTVTKNLGNTKEPPPKNHRELERIFTATIVAAILTLLFLALFRERLHEATARSFWISAQVLGCFFIEIRIKLKMHLWKQT